MRLSLHKMCRAFGLFTLGACLLMAPAGVADNVPNLAGSGHVVRWLPETLSLVHKGGGYGRMIHLQDGRLMVAFSHRGQIHIRISGDAGTGWGEAVQLSSYTGGSATNAELVQLGNGTILVAYNGRPQGTDRPYTIELVSSSDGGQSWTSARVVYAAGSTFENGCWEPAFLALPTGEVQLYFANEAPYPDSNEQEISMLSSGDSGSSWSTPRQVIFRAGHRDGMPVPLLLREEHQIVVAIEDNGLSGKMKPALCRTTLDAPWVNGTVTGQSRERTNPLRTPMAPAAYAGAPYICQTPAGHTVLSYQIDEIPSPGEAHLSAYAVACVGNSKAEQFGKPTAPFASEGNPRSLWNSVFARDDNTITLLSTTTIRGIQGLWMIDGKIEPEQYPHPPSH